MFGFGEEAEAKGCFSYSESAVRPFQTIYRLLWLRQHLSVSAAELVFPPSLPVLLFRRKSLCGPDCGSWEVTLPLFEDEHLPTLLGILYGKSVSSPFTYVFNNLFILSWIHGYFFSTYVIPQYYFIYYSPVFSWLLRPFHYGLFFFLSRS